MKLADRRMLNSDAFAWNMEKDPVLRSTVIAVMRLDRRPDWDRLRSRVDRLTRLVPQLRQRVQTSATRIGPPWWTADASFDLDYHLRHLQLADPGDWSQVLEFMRVSSMRGFDRTRPLWEFTLLDGLPDGGTALVTKLHHSLTDGIGGVQLAALVLDAGPEEGALGVMPELPDDPGSQLLPWSARSFLADTTATLAAGIRLLRSSPSSVATTLRHPVRSARDTVLTAGSMGRFVAPVNQQVSTVIGDRHTRRFLATMDVPFAELHDAARAAGGHLNDAYIAALSGAVSKYHQRRGSSLAELRVTVPISIRTSSDGIGGNRITLLRLKVPAGGAEPSERIAAISEIITRSRQEPSLHHTQQLAFGLSLLPRAYLGGIFKRIELLASDVPGLRQEVWLAGAKMIANYPFGPTIGSALNVTLMSYGATCNIGVNIDSDAIDDPEEMISCLYESFAEICALAPKTPVAAPVVAPGPAKMSS